MSSPARPHRRRRFVPHFSIVETTVLSAILVSGILALTATSLTADSLRRASEEQEIARDALRHMIEDIQRTAYDLQGSNLWAADLVATYAPGGPVGNRFPVQGLTPWPDTEEVGSIRVITDETLTDEELGIQLGLPLDLDFDLRIDDEDVSDDARMLPVVVRIAWVGAAGQMRIQREFLVLTR